MFSWPGRVSWRARFQPSRVVTLFQTGAQLVSEFPSACAPWRLAAGASGASGARAPNRVTSRLEVCCGRRAVKWARSAAGRPARGPLIRRRTRAHFAGRRPDRLCAKWREVQVSSRATIAPVRRAGKRQARRTNGCLPRRPAPILFGGGGGGKDEDDAAGGAPSCC